MPHLGFTIFELCFVWLRWFIVVYFYIKVPPSVELTPEYIEVLRQVTHSLRPKERQLLAKDYSWKDNDEIDQIVSRDKNMLLAAIIYKEIEKQKSEIPYGKMKIYFLLWVFDSVLCPCQFPFVFYPSNFVLEYKN